MLPLATCSVLCADLMQHYAVKTHDSGGIHLGHTTVISDQCLRSPQAFMLILLPMVTVFFFFGEISPR